MRCIHGVDVASPYSCHLCSPLTDGQSTSMLVGVPNPEVQTVAIMAAILAREVPNAWLDCEEAAKRAWTLYRAVELQQLPENEPTEQE